MLKSIGKKLLTATITSALVLTSLIGLTACNNGGETKNSSVPSAKDIFSMAAASGASFIENGSIGSASSFATTQAEEKVRPIDEKTFEDMKTYIGMFDDMLKGGISQVSSKSDKSEYETKLTISIGSKKAYDLYYTEKTVVGNEIIEEDDDDEVKEATTLTGILVSVENEVFNIEGKRTVEVEDGETETEITFVTKEVKGFKSVEVTQKHEKDTVKNEESTEFEYVIKDGINDPIEYSIEWEFEDGAHEMEVGVEQGDREVEYSVKKVSDSELQISYEVEEGNTETEQIIRVIKKENNLYDFIYANGYDKDVDVEIK